MWQTKYASAVPKNLGVGVDFQQAISSPGVCIPLVSLQMFSRRYKNTHAPRYRWARTVDTRRLNPHFFAAQIQIPIPNEHIGA